MASIHRVETGDGPRWRVKWRNRGEPRQCSSNCHTEAAARKVKLAAETAHDLGIPYYGPEAEAEAVAARRVDLRAAARDYLSTRRRAGKSAGTIYQTDICLSLFFDVLDPSAEPTTDDDGNDCMPPLWSTDERGAERLTTAALARYYDHLLTVRRCSLATARSHVEYVQRWWAWLGNSDEYAERLPRPRTIEMAPPPPTPEPVAPTWAEMDAAIACANGHYAHLMTVSRYTGLRGEDQVMELRRSDLDPRAGTLRIRPELGKTPAEKRGRVVPVSRHLLAIVATWPEDPDGWLIHVPPHHRRSAEDNDGVEGPGRYQGPPKRRAWNMQAAGAWERAGVRREVWDTQQTEDGQRKNGRPLHALRRGFISNLQALGANLNDVKYLVGHKLDGGVTVERYTDPALVRTLRETVDLIPPPTLVEVRRIQGGAVVVASQPGGRWRRS
jgi:integrase